jgi:glycosyltransferase involved in cell wall biosynthesis
VTESRKRVLHVLAELHPSGAESMLLAARSVFVDNGFDGEILSTGRDAGPFATMLTAVGYKVHHIPFAKTPGFFVRVYRLMRSGRYEVIHLHTERANFLFGLVALAARPERVVRAVHNAFAFSGNLRWRRMLQRRVLDRSGVVHVAGGANVQEVELAHYGLRTRLVPNWYDSRRFRPPSERERRSARASFGIADGETVLVTIGNCSHIKNHAVLIEALARLPAEARPLYLHVGTEEVNEPEQVLAKRLGIADRVRFLGAVDDLRPVYFASDVFAMPSLHEGRSIAALEALASGLPALFTDVAGLRDLRDVYPGLYYAEPNVDSVTASLAALLAEGPEERRVRATEYPQISRTHFGIEAGVTAYTQIYQGN